MLLIIKRINTQNRMRRSIYWWIDVKYYSINVVNYAISIISLCAQYILELEKEKEKY